MIPTGFSTRKIGTLFFRSSAYPILLLTASVTLLTFAENTLFPKKISFFSYRTLYIFRRCFQVPFTGRSIFSNNLKTSKSPMSQFRKGCGSFSGDCLKTLSLPKDFWTSSSVYRPPKSVAFITLSPVYAFSFTCIATSAHSLIFSRGFHNYLI